jgi:hypothetical protein
VALILAVLFAARMSKSSLTAPGIMLGMGALAALVGVISALLVRRSYDVSLLDWRLARRERTMNLGTDDPPTTP